MKKFLFVVIIAAFAFAGVLLGKSHKVSVIPSGVATTQNVSPTQAVLAAKQAPAVPVHITIPAINVDTAVGSVGMDSQGRMDVPKTSDDTAWYDLGFKPGEKGSAVIDGHLDKVTGAPAVFWNLKNLQSGDKITITDAHNQSYTFVVTSVMQYPWNDFPLQQVFNTTDKPRLNLITCSGTWDEGTHNYSTRTVVYSELMQ